MFSVTRTLFGISCGKFIDSFENGASQRASWSVGYWSKLIKPSSVEKYGTALDKRYLLSETEYLDGIISNAARAIFKSILEE